MARYNRLVVGDDGFRRSILVQFGHGFPIPILEGAPEWPPCIHISGSRKDGRECPAAFDLKGRGLRGRTVERGGDESKRSAPTSEVPDLGIGIQSHRMQPTAAEFGGKDRRRYVHKF